MTKVRAEVDIDAPVDRVFAFFDDLDNARLLVPSLVEVVNVETLANGGRHVEYTTHNKHGDLVDVTSDHVDYDPPHRTVTRTKQSGVETTSTRLFAPNTSGGTRVVATVEWSVPVKYFGAIVSLPLRGPLRRSLRTSLATAKDAIEA
jgi:uncharacterized protein YndB with AHSA1/START domain